MIRAPMLTLRLALSPERGCAPRAFGASRSSQ